jgi:hypothetical protein
MVIRGGEMEFVEAAWGTEGENTSYREEARRAKENIRDNVRKHI